MQISDLDTRGSGRTVQEGISSHFSVVTGLVLLVLVALAFASLATWSVNDPSLSYATKSAPGNMVGYPGAVFADLVMQFLGLAAALALIPPAIWGWSKLMQRNIGHIKMRCFFWVLSVAFASSMFACFSVPQSWPLPLGLGGLVGDSLVGVIGYFLGPVNGVTAFLFGASFLLAGMWSILAASRLIWKTESDEVAEEPNELADEEYDQPSWLLGAFSHYLFVFKNRFFQKREKKQEDIWTEEEGPGLWQSVSGWFARLTQRDDDFALQPQTSGLAHDPNMEPMPHPAPEQPLGYGENIYNDYETQAAAQEFQDVWDEPNVQIPQAEPMASPPLDDKSLVQPMAPPPKPSARTVREAQPSLIETVEFELPSLHFLQEKPEVSAHMQLSSEALEQNAKLLEGVLQDFGVKGEIINVRPGPVVTLYELEPAPGIKSSRVIGLADDIARSMSAIAARVAVVPGRNAIGIELPNANRQTVFLREILASKNYEEAKAKLPIILGKTIGGEATIADLAKMPHLLVAGTTGSGKSVAINTMILSILYRMTPEQVKMIMIDPKMLELSIYDGIPHLLTPVVTDPKKAVVALKWTVREMEDRYKNMSKVGVRNIDGYNKRIADAVKKGERITRTIQTGYDRDTGEAIYETEELDLSPMPYIVVVIDEMADLMMVAGKDIEGAIQRLAQMARAAGIHVIMATQRPSVDVITGTIKANFPTRISFQVTSKIDSRTILGEQGAEQLLGMGDMLYMAGGGRIQRVHGPFVADDEVDQVVNHLKSQGVPQYLEAVTEETEEDAQDGGTPGTDGLAQSNDIYDQAVAIVLRDRKVSTSYIQRRLSIGYNRAASLIERMEQEGLISAANHAGKREILVPAEDETI